MIIDPYDHDNAGRMGGQDQRIVRVSYKESPEESGGLMAIKNHQEIVGSHLCDALSCKTVWRNNL